MNPAPTHSEVAPCVFLDDGIFGTKDGDSGILLRLYPRDSECMDADGIAAVARRFDAGMRLISPACIVYQFMAKRRVRHVVGPAARAEFLQRKKLFEFEFRMVLIHKGVDIYMLRNLAESFLAQIGAEIPGQIENKQDAFDFFRNILNYDRDLAGMSRLRYDRGIDFYACDSQIEAHRSHLMVGDYFVKVLTMKDAPPATYPDILRNLREIPYECLAVSEWVPLSHQQTKDLISKTTTHFHRSKLASNLGAAALDALGKIFGGSVAPKERLEDMQKDEGAVAMEAQMGALARDIEENSTTLGEWAFTVMVFDHDLNVVDKAASAAVKAVSSIDGVLYQEKYNALSAFLACIPGGRRHQRRQMYLTNRNYADVSFLFAPSTGNERNEHLQSAALALLETRQLTPYHGNLHYQDVGHTLISGQTGSGKSFLANHLIACARNNYDARIVIFDIGGSYKSLTREMGGSYMDIGLKHDFTINPFSLPDNEENRHFWFSFVKVLIESGEHRMGDVEQDALYQAIPGVRRLVDLMDKLPRDLRPYLARWCGSGQYGRLFDNAEDTLTCAKFQTFDFEGLEKFPQILEPLLFYVLHRANADIYDSSARGVFKVFLLDEAWKFLMNPTVKFYIYESLKTWRKKNAAMWLATQSIGDLQQTEMLRTVAENCGSIVLLPNPRMDKEQYREVFKLNERELDLVATMQPKRESLWKPVIGEAKVVVLDLGGKA